MKWFYNIKMATKLTGAFIVVSLLTAVVGYEGLTNMRMINQLLETLYKNETLGIAYIKEANVDLIYYGRAQNNFLLSSTQEDRDKYLNRMRQYEDLLMRNVALSRPLIQSEKGKELIASFEREWNDYHTVVDKVVSLAKSENLDAKRQSVQLSETTAREKSDLIDTLFAQLVRLKEERGKEFYTESANLYADARTYLLFLMIGAVGIGIGFGIFISGVISKQIKLVGSRVKQLQGFCITNLANGINALSNGDLSLKVEYGTPLLNLGTKDEIGELAGSVDNIIEATANTVQGFEKTREKIREVISETNNLTEAYQRGNLDIRGNTENYTGAYKQLISSINNSVGEIIRPVKESSKVIEEISAGDLTARVTGDFKGDHQLIKNSINNLGNALQKIIGEVTEAVQATASAANQISSSTEEMAAGSTEQSQQASEVAGAVEEMTRTILETTKNAGAAREASGNYGSIAKEGGNVVNETIAGMNKITEVVQKSAGTVKQLGKSSEEIGEIIQVIDDIADQTNLLALNAAIEAARAGEQGRGFAVVADEVRKLAERTTKATKEIAAMIKQIQKDTVEAVVSMDEGTSEVEKGRLLADKAGESLKQIITGAENVVDIITQVAAASEEQSTASEQISKNIEAISSVIEQSSAGIQQIARAAEDLGRLTLNLESLISKFKISGVSDAVNNNTAQGGSIRKSLPHSGIGKSYVKQNRHLVS